MPNLRSHLISLLKLVDDTGYWFVLDSDDCFLCDKVSGSRISSSRREDGLLYLDNPMAQLSLLNYSEGGS